MSASAQDKIVADFEKKLFDSALGADHAYRKLNRLINFDKVASDLQKLYSHLGQHGIPAVRGLKAMLLQFWEDYSDREMEAAVRENLFKDPFKNSFSCVTLIKRESSIIIFMTETIVMVRVRFAKRLVFLLTVSLFFFG